MPQSGRRWMVAGGDSTAGGPLESPCVPQVADPHPARRRSDNGLLRNADRRVRLHPVAARGSGCGRRGRHRRGRSGSSTSSTSWAGRCGQDRGKAPMAGWQRVLPAVVLDRLDEEHSADPYHAAVLHNGHWGLTKIEQTAVCSDHTRHGEDGNRADGPLSPPGDRRGSLQVREDRAAKHREKEAQSRRLTDRLTALPDEAVIAAVVRRQARTVLQRPHLDDPLLLVPEGVVDPLEPWMFPSQVIDSVDIADLARWRSAGGSF